MRIGYIYDLQIYPPKGGNHVHVLELIQGFLRNGHEVFVIDDPTFPGVRNFAPSKVIDFLNAIDILYIRIDARFTKNNSLLNSCIDNVIDKPIVLEINAPSNEALAYSFLGGTKETNITDESILKLIKRGIHALRNMPRIHLEELHRKQLSKKVHAAICVSNALGKYAKEFLKIENVVILPNGGPLLSLDQIKNYRLKKNHEQFTVLYSGSALYPWQGLNFLKPVIEHFYHNNQNIKFELCVNQYIESLPKTPNVEIKISLNRDELFERICQADLCLALHPEYFWSPWKFHGSPMKMFEYMGCGTPVLASNIGQMKDLITDGVNGFLCENKTESIIGKIEYAYKNKDKLTKVGMRGRDFIKSDRTWNHNINQTIELFSRLLNR
jgi:glycosyltransferase involved in cell wall biosynthesis